MNSVLSNRGKSYGVEHILAARSASLSELLTEQLGLDPGRTAELLKFGSIYLNHQRLPNSLNVMHISQGDYLRVHQNPRRFPAGSIAWKNCIIENNSEFLVINKPAGLPVHPTVDNTQENLRTLLSDFLNENLLITSRLDLPTSGLLVFAKTKEFQKHYNECLTHGSVQKIYRALVENKPVPLGVWTHYMEPSPRAPKNISKEPNPGWVTCQLNILETQDLNSEFNILLIELLTGRTHQIRAQLAKDGFPIVGDAAYGSTKGLSLVDCQYSEQIEEIALQCCSLRFPDPQQTWHEFKLRPPPWPKSGICHNFYNS